MLYLAAVVDEFVSIDLFNCLSQDFKNFQHCQNRDCCCGDVHFVVCMPVLLEICPEFSGKLTSLMHIPLSFFVVGCHS